MTGDNKPSREWAQLALNGMPVAGRYRNGVDRIRKVSFCRD